MTQPDHKPKFFLVRESSAFTDHIGERKFYPGSKYKLEPQYFLDHSILEWSPDDGVDHLSTSFEQAVKSRSWYDSREAAEDAVLTRVETRLQRYREDLQHEINEVRAMQAQIFKASAERRKSRGVK